MNPLTNWLLVVIILVLGHISDRLRWIHKDIKKHNKE